ncbi:MAG: DNA-deoxyinosine glycosylase [Clostridia bacterium]|jgi:hypoxanthine-DNA glycosylase|nr:DNA-deoxyinosine glycosylase [Clostridia bacterium]
MEIKENYSGFQPFIDENSEILILGSFPSVKSRQNNFYYGNSRNRFWKVLASAFNEECPQTIEEKKMLCQRHKIALWDVFWQSDLKGSSDQTLSKSNIVLSDLNGLIKRYPNIKKILCNGALAYDTLTKNFNFNIEIKKLHSTSPACVNFNLDEWITNLK